MAVEFLILGPLEIRLDGRSLDVSGARRRALLAALLLRAGAPLSSDWLLEALRGDGPPLSPNALQVTVSRARRDLGPLADRLKTEARGYRLVVEPGELDADASATASRRRGTCSPPGAPPRRRRCSTGCSLSGAGRRSPMSPTSRSRSRRPAGLEEMRVQALEDRVEADLEPRALRRGRERGRSARRRTPVA